MKTPTFIPQFKIYKKDTTVEVNVTILPLKGEPFNRQQKITKYLYLGYKVFDLNDNEIKLTNN